jgi:hypothetical protein
LGILDHPVSSSVSQSKVNENRIYGVHVSATILNSLFFCANDRKFFKLFFDATNGVAPLAKPAMVAHSTKKPQAQKIP